MTERQEATAMPGPDEGEPQAMAESQAGTETGFKIAAIDA